MGFTGVWEIFDQGFPLDPIDRFISGIYIWNSHSWGTGASALASINSIPIGAIVAGLAYLGLPPNVIQRVLLVLFTALTGWSMYYLVSTVFSFKSEGAKRVASLIAGIFYMLNPFWIYWMTIGAYMGGFWALPLTFAFIHKGFKACEHKQKWVKYAVFVALLSTFLSMANPEITIILLGFFSLYILYVVVSDIFSRRFSVLFNYSKFLATLVIASLSINSWWLLPTFYAELKVSAVSSIIERTAGGISGLARVERFSYRPLNFLQVLRLHIFGFSKDWPPYPLGLWITSPFIVSLGIFLFGFLMCAPILKSKDKYVIFFALSTIISTGLASGTAQPLGLLYLWLWNNVQFFRILSDPSKFMYISLFGYSVLLGISTSEVYRRLSEYQIKLIIIRRNHNHTIALLSNKLAPKLFVSIMTFLLLLNSYPLFSGNLYGSLEFIDIPNYYLEARSWLLQEEVNNYRVLRVPINLPGLSPSYTWSPYSISFDVLWSVIRFPGPTLSSYPIPATIVEQTKNLGKMLSLWNIKYLVVANDIVNPATNEKMATSHIRDIFGRQIDLRLVRSFGELNFYQNLAYKDSWVYGSSIYLIIPEQTEWSIYQALCDLEDFHPADVVMFTSKDAPSVAEIRYEAIDISQYIAVDQVTGEIRLMDNLTIPKNVVRVTYERINPTKYIVYINAVKPFVLVLSESYDPLWRAKIVNDDRELPHFQVNFYANGWFINKTGKFDVIIEYELQKVLNIGFIISTLSAVGFIALITVPKLVRKIRRP